MFFVLLFYNVYSLSKFSLTGNNNFNNQESIIINVHFNYAWQLFHVEYNTEYRIKTIHKNLMITLKTMRDFYHVTVILVGNRPDEPSSNLDKAVSDSFSDIP